MCGIAGIFEYGRTSGGVDEALLVRMRETMRHRGPDGEGLFVSPDRRLGVAHRRLAIIDLDGGAQPMHGPNGTRNNRGGRGDSCGDGNRVRRRDVSR